jgi:hypothetical protein
VCVLGRGQGRETGRKTYSLPGVRDKRHPFGKYFDFAFIPYISLLLYTFSKTKERLRKPDECPKDTVQCSRQWACSATDHPKP